MSDKYTVPNGNFTHIYEQICDFLRRSGNLQRFQNEFQNSFDDWDRIKILHKWCDFRNIKIKKKETKDPKQALHFEEQFDHLITVGNSQEAIATISKSIQYTEARNNRELSERYSKRAWGFLVNEQLENSILDANRSLNYQSARVWKPYEILGHCYAKMSRHEEARNNFAKSLQNLRNSEESNVAKADTAKRIAIAIKKINELPNQPIIIQGESPHKLKLPIPFGGRNLTLSSASSKVNVKYSTNNGRGMFAGEDITPGSIIIVEEPYVAVLSDVRWNTHCIQCLKSIKSPLPCDGCTKVWFCSEDCKQDPNSFHHKECPIVPYIFDESLGVMAPLALRIILQREYTNLISDEQMLKELAKSDDTSNIELKIFNKYASDNYYAVYSQVTNSEKRQFGNLLKRGIAAIFLTFCLQTVSFFSGEHLDKDFNYIAGLILRHLQSCSCNAYEISEPSKEIGVSEGIGGAVYSTISLSNHSCAPNCHRYNVGNAGILRASKLIRKGEEIFDNYGHFYYAENIKERQIALRSNYMFECSCVACANHWPTYETEENELCFKCPGVECRSIITDYFGIRGCDNCCKKKFYKKFVNRIKQKLNDLDNVKELIRTGNYGRALSAILDHQIFIDTFSASSSKHVIRVQEILKHCHTLEQN